MPVNTYTPTAAYPAYPVVIAKNTEYIDEVWFNDKYQDLYDRIHYNKTNRDFDLARFNNALTKIGIVVVDASDVTIPTYTSGYVLVGPLTHHAALNNLDNELSFKNTQISNVNNNVGGNVALAATPVYSSHAVLVDGDSHHTSLEKIDTATGVLQTAVANSATDITTQTNRITAIVDKVGIAADTAGTFTYATHNFLVDGNTLKTIAEKYDKVVFGNRRTGEYAFQEWVHNWAKLEGLANIKAEFFETFYDTTKRTPTYTTATLDLDQRQASGAGTFYYATTTATATISQVAFRWNGTGTITVKYNAINSFSDGDMVTITTPDTFTVTAAPGTQIVIKVELTGTAVLYNLAMLAKV